MVIRFQVLIAYILSISRAEKRKVASCSVEKEIQYDPEKELFVDISQADAALVSVPVDEFSYAQVFSEQVLSGVPFKSAFISPQSISYDLLQACKKAMESARSSRSSIKQCNIPSTSIQIPSLASNSYLYRLQHLHGLGSEVGPSYLTPIDSTNFYSCPLGLHQIIFSLDQSEIKYFLKKTNFSISSSTQNDNVYSGILDANEYLFVPNHISVAFEAKSSVPLLVNLCILDASNHQLFLQYTTAFGSKALAESHPLVEEMSQLNVAEVMKYEPAESTLHALIRPSRVEEDASFSKSKSPNYTLKQWSAINKWKLLIQSLTLPTPKSLQLRASGRRQLVLDWISAFVPSEKDTTDFGFVVTFCSLGSSLPSTTDADSSSVVMIIEVSKMLDQEYGTSCYNVTVLRPLTPYTAPQKRALSLMETAYLKQSLHEAKTLELGKEVYSFSTVIYANLNPGQDYIARIQTLFNNRRSRPSEWSTCVSLRPYSVPGGIPRLIDVRDEAQNYMKSDLLNSKAKNKFRKMSLHSIQVKRHEEETGSFFVSFFQPKDDGGHKIEGYQVYGRLASHACTSEYNLASFFSSMERVPFDEQLQRLADVNEEQDSKASESGASNEANEALNTQASVSSSSKNESQPSSRPTWGYHLTNCSRGIIDHFPSTWQWQASHVLGDEIAKRHSSLYQLGKALSWPLISLKVPAPYMHVPWEIRVCAQNRLGCGPFSDVAMPVLLEPLASRSTPMSSVRSETEIFGLGCHRDDRAVLGQHKARCFTIDMHAQTLRYQEHSVEGWACHWSPAALMVTAALVWESEMQSGSTARLASQSVEGSVGSDLINEATSNNIHLTLGNSGDAMSAAGKIVVAFRDGTPLVHKILKYQMLGAVGILLVDRGRCTRFDQRCMPGSDKDSRGGGATSVYTGSGDRWAAHDAPEAWKHVRVPALFVLRTSGLEFITTHGGNRSISLGVEASTHPLLSNNRHSEL